jgi:DNA-binding Lrp family transcriptional regulator
MMKLHPSRAPVDATDRAIIHATQGGLPLTPRPYHTIGETIGLSGDQVMARMQRLLGLGVIRRIAAVPNHFALGYRANGMSVWDVLDEETDAAGQAVGALDFVSHCYRRPRHLPLWRFNLFAMLHAKTREEVEEKVRVIESLLGAACRAHDVLYSTRILKKTGLRLSPSS